MSPYADGTTVTAIQSRAELETLLRKRGALRTAFANEPGSATIAFELADRRIQFTMPLPTEADVQKKKRVGGTALERAVAKAERERWRAMVLAVKAKFVSVDAGVETLEEAFLAHVVVPGGTVGRQVKESIAIAYGTGKMPTGGLLLGSGQSQAKENT